MTSNITINVNNATSDRDLYVLIFQKPEDANPNEIYKTLFPVAWKVLPLSPQSSCEPVVYPMTLQVSSKESQDVWNAAHRGTIKDCKIGQTWEFTTEGDFSRLAPANQAAVDGVVSVANNSDQCIDVGMARGGSPLIVQRGVAQGEQADFQLAPKLYFLVTSNISEGDLILSGQITQNAYEVDLTGLRSVDVTVGTTCPTSGELGWSHTSESV